MSDDHSRPRVRWCVKHGRPLDCCGIPYDCRVVEIEKVWKCNGCGHRSHMLGVCEGCGRGGSNPNPPSWSRDPIKLGENGDDHPEGWPSRA